VREAKIAKIYETLDQVLSPRHTAFVVVDVQNDLCHPDGAFARAGFAISDIRAAIPNILRLVDAARAAGVFVVWLLNTRLPHGLSDAGASERMRGHYQMPEVCLDGTWGQALVEELVPREGESVIKKHRSSGFTGTSLDLVLRTNGIETVVVAGVATEGCVDSTVRDGVFHNYYAVCVTDAMASTKRELHNAAVTIMRARYDCLETSELVRYWRET
jgi:nicotinamidase-related amidase